uniref:muconolactone Delta-isomerase family protein n=1 Tax=Burkholderia diffusa TaxID=488732 RepID=UPI001CC6BBC0|nr:muconolactone Delta-isomerase family protein [Burkholderia diffusa]
MKRFLLDLTTAFLLLAFAGVSMAQPTPMPTTPTTKILAVGTFPPGTDMQRVQTILPTEVRETAQLYLDGKIDQWYSLQDRAGVVFILNVTDMDQAHRMLEELPLGKAHSMTFSLLPIGPLKPLTKLLNPPSP